MRQTEKRVIKHCVSRRFRSCVNREFKNRRKTRKNCLQSKLLLCKPSGDEVLDNLEKVHTKRAERRYVNQVILKSFGNREKTIHEAMIQMLCKPSIYRSGKIEKKLQKVGT